MNQIREKELTQEQAAEVMDFAICLGEEILVRGGELWRVEAVLNEVFQDYGLKNTAIFMLPHTLLITTYKEGEQSILRHKNIGAIVVDMEKLSRLNTLIRQVREEQPEPSELSGMLKTAVAGKTYSRPMTLLGMVIALLSLNYIIGGGWKDAIFIALGISVVMGADLFLGAFKRTNKMLVCGVGSFLICAIDLLAFHAGIVTDPFHILVVTSIGLVPGIPLINSCREMFYGRVLGGALLFMTAFMETLAVVCGFAVAIAVLGV